jgi:hypothetical protein
MDIYFIIAGFSFVGGFILGIIAGIVIAVPSI